MEYIHSKYCMCNSCTELKGESQYTEYRRKEFHKLKNEEKRKRYFDKKRHDMLTKALKDYVDNLDPQYSKYGVNPFRK